MAKDAWQNVLLYAALMKGEQPRKAIDERYAWSSPIVNPFYYTDNKQEVLNKLEVRRTSCCVVLLSSARGKGWFLPLLNMSSAKDTRTLIKNDSSTLCSHLFPVWQSWLTILQGTQGGKWCHVRSHERWASAGPWSLKKTQMRSKLRAFEASDEHTTCDVFYLSHSFCWVVVP